MDIKGTAVRSTEDFVRDKFNHRYDEWLESLPLESKKIFREGVLTNRWYPVDYAAIIPTQKLVDLFYGGDVQKGAWEMGRFSAATALTGIYKIYVKLSKPYHLIDRASRIFAAYYDKSIMVTRNPTKTSIDVVIEKFDKPSEALEYRIGGWMEKALEISGSYDISVKIGKSIAKGWNETIFNCSWKVK